MDHHGAKCTQIGAQTCQGTSRTGQNFFTFTFQAVGVTFLKVILHLLQKVLNRPFWISLAVVSYLFPPVFLTSLPHLCCIPQHCLSLHAGYWRKKERDLDQNLVRIVVFSVPDRHIFLLVMWHLRNQCQLSQTSSIKTREVLGNPSLMPKRFPETRKISRGRSPRESKEIQSHKRCRIGQEKRQ